MKRRIYYYDTDCGGVVYYGNYLKFLEEARTEYMEERGLSVKALMDEGIWFVVKRQEIEYKAPAVYGDIVETRTWVNETSGIRVQFGYEIKNQDGKIISKAVTDMVCVGPDFKIKEMPAEIRSKIAA
ncbi:MAG: thioesterase family protein [Elusimicrobia bacterium]|nr:thioesterase family protein [Elusimicrobiota bacterium]